MEINMNYKKIFLNKFKYISALILCATQVSVSAFNVSATETVDYAQAAEERKLLPIQSNETADWPEGPAITAEAAILMEANTGTILYAKNIHEELYPASTTKILTCLLAVENASLDDTVTFSQTAVSSVPADGSSMGIDAGESLSLEECLYGIMVGSANEAANAVAEHVAGSIENFVELMNERAAELGCTNTHFNNANGLQDSNHYTSAYDLALISREFFDNELLSKIGNTARYHFTPTATQPDDFYLNNKHKLINGEIAYDGILGGKTGYTDLARETLVTCAEQNGMKLICVVFMDESPAQFTDTVTLFDYGFGNFQVVNVADNETNYIPTDSSFFDSENDIFGSSSSLLEIDESSYIILPKTSDITSTTSTVSFDLTEDETKDTLHIAKINYDYNGVAVGSAYVNAIQSAASSAFTSADTENEDTSDSSPASSQDTIYINIKLVLIIVLIVAAIIIAIIMLHSLFSSYSFSSQRSDRRRMRRRKKEVKKGHNKFKHYD